MARIGYTKSLQGNPTHIDWSTESDIIQVRQFISLQGFYPAIPIIYIYIYCVCACILIYIYIYDHVFVIFSLSLLAQGLFRSFDSDAICNFFFSLSISLYLSLSLFIDKVDTTSYQRQFFKVPSGMLLADADVTKVCAVALGLYIETFICSILSLQSFFYL